MLKNVGTYSRYLYSKYALGKYIYSRVTIHPIFKVEVSNMSQLRRSLIRLVVADDSSSSSS